MKTCPHCGEVLDRRGSKWRVRVRLYEKGADEPIADTDTDLPPSAAGATVLHSLPTVAQHVSHLAHGFHATKAHEITGLDMPTLRHRLKGFRPTVSRRGGNATWRIPYTVHAAAFTARVDVERVT